MRVLNIFQTRKVSITPTRLSHALPSILLGTLFNVLDAVSTGLLIFPSNSNTFESLQIQAMSMYIMSTIVSQMVMTLGGSLIPGALGAMLIEILPFLRGIGSDIQHTLGNDNPALIPTVMVAYALTSFLIGIVFVALGAFKAGILVAYFPRPVLTGVIGGIGVSLFILGLGLPLPTSSPALTLTSAGSVLFGLHHLGLLFASCVPAFFLSFSLRSDFIRRCTFGKSQHAYYIPIYFILIPILFWITVAGLHHTDSAGMNMLVKNGWLFGVDNSTKRKSGIGLAWVYWTLFDFSKVEIHALKNATTNIVLLVIIGVLNLPIYVPALGSSLSVPVNMNHEFVGQGVANILAGLTGTVPNVLQLSYSIFFTRAGGGRFEAGIVTILTFVFFFVSSMVIPYVPTVLASTLVLFLGIELTSEAVWESAKTLQFTEWLVVMVTLIACTFLGYAIGFGVGIGAATVVYLIWGVLDTRACLVDLDQEGGNLRYSSRYHYPSGPRDPAQKKVPSTISEIPLFNVGPQDLTEMQCASGSMLTQCLPRISVLSLSGYIFFGNIPSIEASIKARKEQTKGYRFLVVDLTCVHRLETSAVGLLEREARENLETRALVFCGVSLDSAVYADLQRGGLKLNFGAQWLKRYSIDMLQMGPMGFEERAEAIKWCKSQIKLGLPVHCLDKPTLLKNEPQDLECDEDAVKAFRELPRAQRLFQDLFLFPRNTGPENHPVPLNDLIARFRARGGRINSYCPGQLIKTQGDSAARAIFIVRGRVFFEDLLLAPPRNKSRASLLNILKSFMQTAWSSMNQRQKATANLQSLNRLVSRTLTAGESFAVVDEVTGKELDDALPTYCDQVAVSPHGTCWTIEVHRPYNASSLWPLSKQWTLDAILAERETSSRTDQIP